MAYRPGDKVIMVHPDNGREVPSTFRQWEKVWGPRGFILAESWDEFAAEPADYPEDAFPGVADEWEDIIDLGEGETPDETADETTD